MRCFNLSTFVSCLWVLLALEMTSCSGPQADGLIGGLHPTLEVGGVHYAYLGQRETFEADNFLNLTAKRLYQLEIVPEIRRASPVPGMATDRLTSEPFAAGSRFHLRAFVAAPQVEVRGDSASRQSWRVLSTMEWESVQVSQRSQKPGALVVPFAFAYDFTERAHLEGPMRLYIEVTPLDAPELLPVTVRAVFNPLADQFPSTALQTMDHSFDAFLQEWVPQDEFYFKDLTLPKPLMEGEVALYGVRLSKPRLLSEVYNPFEAIQEDASAVYLAEDSATVEASRFAPFWDRIRTLLESDKTMDLQDRETRYRIFLLGKSLCEAVFESDLLKHSCEKAPKDHLRMEFVDIIDQSPGEPLPIHYRGTDQSQLQVMGRFFMEEIETTRSYEAFQIGKGFERGLTRKVGAETLGTGIGAYTGFVQHREQTIYSGEDANTFDVRNRVEVREIQTLMVDRSYFDVTAKFRRCLGVRAIDQQEMTLFCTEAKDQTFSEHSWYFISDLQQMSNMGRSLGWEAGHRRWLQYIRGQDLYRKFKNAMEAETGELVLVRFASFFEGTSGLLKDAVYGKHSMIRWMANEGRLPGVLHFRTLRDDLYTRSVFRY